MDPITSNLQSLVAKVLERTRISSASDSLRECVPSEYLQAVEVELIDTQGGVCAGIYGVCAVERVFGELSWPISETCFSILIETDQNGNCPGRAWARLISVSALWPPEEAFLQEVDDIPDDGWSASCERARGEAGIELASIGGQSGGDPYEVVVNGERRSILNTKLCTMVRLLGSNGPGWIRVASLPRRFVIVSRGDEEEPKVVAYRFPFLRYFGMLGGVAGHNKKVHSGNPFYSDLVAGQMSASGVISFHQGTDALRDLARFSEA